MTHPDIRLYRDRKPLPTRRRLRQRRRDPHLAALLRRTAYRVHDERTREVIGRYRSLGAGCTGGPEGDEVHDRNGQWSREGWDGS